MKSITFIKATKTIKGGCKNGIRQLIIMKNKSIIPIFIATTLVLASCSNNAQQGPPKMPPAAVNIEVVTEGSGSYYEQYPATVTALNQVELRPQVSGYITGIHFQDGQHVTKGQLLYSIDQQTYQAGVNQAQANLAVAKANMTKAQKDADRYIALDKKDAIAKQVLDHSLADLESAKMQVRAAEANVNGVQTNLRYSNIYAPFSGTIGISMVKMGASVSPGTTLLNTVSTDDPIAVDFFLDQKELSRFNELLKNNQQKNDSVFSLVLADNTTYPFSGKISSIDRAVDAQTGTIRVRLEFKNEGKALRPGMSATAKVYHRASGSAILIPYKAVSEQMGEYFVYKVTDSNTVTQTKIKLGNVLDTKVVVKEGLNVGDKIVVEGLQRLKEGVKITTDTSSKKEPKK
jgi:RND family efflux transporter MFP subunit